MIEDPTGAVVLPEAERPSRRRLVLHVAFGLVGVGAMTAMIVKVGPAILFDALARCATFLPLLTAIEIIRLGLEVVATRVLSPAVKKDVPLSTLTRAVIVGFAVSAVMPAGRVSAEATKAAMTARHLGGPRAAAIAATNQALCLFASAAIAVVCALVAFAKLGSTAVAWGCLVSAIMTTLAYAGVQIATRARTISGFLGRRFAKIRAATASFQDALAELPIFPARAAAVWFSIRLLQTLEFAILVFAVGGGLHASKAFIAEGIAVAGGAAGDFIPGQLGATDGAFALSAASLQIAVADAMAIALVAHFLQLAGAAACAITPLLWREARRVEAVAE
jgi:hypothetical protein